MYLSVYDLMIMNYTINRMGLGVYHTAIQVYDRGALGLLGTSFLSFRSDSVLPFLLRAEYSYAGHYYTENTGLKESMPGDTSWLHDAVFRWVHFLSFFLSFFVPLGVLSA